MLERKWKPKNRRYVSATGIRYSNVTGMYLSCTTGNKVNRCEQTLHLRAGVSPL